MAVLTVQTTDRIGTTNLTTLAVAAGAGGDSFPNDGQTLLYVSNGYTLSQTISQNLNTTPSAKVDSLTPANRTIGLSSLSAYLLGPFPTAPYNDSNGRMNFTYSGVLSLTVCPVKVGT